MVEMSSLEMLPISGGLKSFLRFAQPLLDYPSVTFAIRPNTMLSIVYHIKVLQDRHPKPLTVPRYALFYAGKGFIYLYMLTLTLRAWILCAYLKGEAPDLRLYGVYDPIMGFAMLKFNFLNFNTMLAASVLPFFALYIDYSLSFQSDLFITSIQYEINIENAQDIVYLNEAAFTPPELSLSEEGASFAQIWALLREIWNSNHLLFKKRKLKYFPNISRKIRGRLILYGLAIEVVFTFIHFLAALIAIAGVCLFWYDVSDEVSPPTMCIALLDGALLIYITWNAIRMGFFSIHVIATLGFVSFQIMGELNRHIREALHQEAGGSYIALKVRLDALRQEHIRLQGYAGHVNDLVSSKLLLVTLLTNGLLNMTMISMLIFEHLHLPERTVTSLIIFLQLTISLQGCVALTLWASCFASSNRLLFLSQIKLDSAKVNGFLRTAILPAKLKLMRFYEAICSDDAFKFTVGHFGGICKRSIFDFLLGYSMFILYISKMILKAQKKARESLED